jgi:hypothetical protein
MEDHLTWGEGQGLGGGRVTAEEATAVPGRAGASDAHRIVTLLGWGNFVWTLSPVKKKKLILFYSSLDVKTSIFYISDYYIHCSAAFRRN